MSTLNYSITCNKPDFTKSSISNFKNSLWRGPINKVKNLYSEIILSETSSIDLKLLEKKIDELTIAVRTDDSIKVHLLRDFKISTFKGLLRSRIKYLSSLSSIGDNWISGASVAPNRFTIDKSVEILQTLYEKVKFDENFIIPTLIMGPIPEGGFLIEFEISKDLILFVSIFNSGVFELEYEMHDKFQDVEVDLNNFIEVFLEKYYQMCLS